MYEQKLKAHRKVLTIMTIVLLVLFALKIAAFVIYAKGLRVPRWLDILW